jgi:phenylacetate-CoA ligase
LERYAELDALQNKIHEALKSVLGLDCKVTLVQPRTITRFEGKAKRIIDLRNESQQ